jgi:group I intron endonuclease
MIGIYKITSPSGKVYIGQTIDIDKRFKTYKGLHCENQTKLYNSLVKYGFSEHIFEIVEQCTIEELNTRERYWQDQYSVLSENGLNCILTETDSKSGKQSEASIERRVGKIEKPVIQYSLQGKFIAEWSSIKKAAEFLNIYGGDIPACCKGKNKSAQGFIWRYKKGTIASSIEAVSIGKYLPILQYSLDGIFIREWESIKEARESQGKSRPDIMACLQGRQKQAGGCIWKYKKKYQKIVAI